VTDRRSFISTLSAGGVWFTRPSWLKTNTGALRVDAVPTVFFAHPDGVRNMVRFEVSGIDAPAGRLRVFDRSRRLLGTAGLLRSGDRLYGELWMQLDDAVRAVSELEAPGLRGPFRTTHRLVPGRRWTIHLMTVADPDSIADTLSYLRPSHRAVQAALYRNSLVTVNPFRVSALSRLEHVPFLRMAERALAIEQDYAIPVGTAAYISPGVHLPKTGALALAGAGVRVLLREQQESEPFEWWDVPGGTRLLVITLPKGSTPSALGFGLSQDEMTRRVEDWLSSAALRFSPDEHTGTAAVLNASVDDTLSATLDTISTWNSRFAYPRIVVGNHRVLFEDLDANRTDTSVVEPTSIHVPSEPSGDELLALREARESLSNQRSHDLARVLGQAVASGLTELEDVAALLATAVPGTMVFNPSPFQHSDLVPMSDGSERLATNVPGLGYAFFPDVSVTGETNGWESIDSVYSAAGQHLEVTIDETSGAISSLLQLAEGKEWVQQGSGGLNAVPDARFLKISAARVPDTATRFVVSRWAPRVGTFTSTVTVYDELPWLSLVNETEAVAGGKAVYRFHLDVTEPDVSWEVPGGYDKSAPPVQAIEHLRWMSLSGQDETLMFRGFDAPFASVDIDATITSVAPRGIARYRLAPLPKFSTEDMPWVFGWNSEPMIIARVQPNGRDVLPRYGSMFDVEQVGVTILGAKPAADGFGAIVYLQETLGVSRTISFGPGLLKFGGAETVDYLERYLEQLQLGADGSIQLELPANSVVALRLSVLEVSN